MFLWFQPHCYFITLVCFQFNCPYCTAEGLWGQFSLRTNTESGYHKPSYSAQCINTHIGGSIDNQQLCPLTASNSLPGSVSVSASLDCLVAEQGCIQEQSCLVLYRLLEYCAAEEAVSPLGPDARLECLEAQNSLHHYRPLQVCKCQRGSRREEHCLKVYWTVRFAGELKHRHVWGDFSLNQCDQCNNALNCCFSI